MEMAMIPVLGTLIFTSQYTYSLACRYEPKAGIITTIVCSNILLTFLLDCLIMHTRLTTTNVVGACIVFASVVAIAVLKEKPK